MNLQREQQNPNFLLHVATRFTHTQRAECAKFLQTRSNPFRLVHEKKTKLSQHSEYLASSVLLCVGNDAWEFD